MKKNKRKKTRPTIILIEQRKRKAKLGFRGKQKKRWDLELGEKHWTGIEILPNESGFEALEELRDFCELRIHGFWASLSLSSAIVSLSNFVVGFGLLGE